MAMDAAGKMGVLRVGTNGYTWSFEQRAAFWFSMILCDTESAPEYTDTCAPDTDHNIFTSTDPGAMRVYPRVKLRSRRARFLS